MGRQHADAADGGCPDLGAARDGQPPRLPGGATDPRIALDSADQPVHLEELPIKLEHLVGVVIPECDRDGVQEGSKGVGIGARLAELE
jgi:hypothetical protein